MKAFWPHKLLADWIDGESRQSKQELPLAEAVEQARQEWIYAQNYYNSVLDADLVDHAVYLLKAAEKKYVYLMKKARSQGVTYSPF
ncbi:MAG: hypothetical protein H6Q75_594 [Firmicutes bacterium]|nr:hypothetical protein [Bacillota bacterium]